MSEEKAAWVKFYPSDWLAGTRGLSSAETGVYITLIALMYEREGQIEMNVARLARMCGTSNSAFKKALDVLIEDGKITLENGQLSQKRVLEELSNTQKRRVLASQAAISRWEKSPDKSKADDMREQCDGNADGMPRARDSQSQSQKKKEKTLLPADAGSWQNDDEFIELWNLWKTTDKGAGRSKSPNKLYPIFCRHRKANGFEKVIAGARAYLKSDDCKKSGGQGLDPWLNGERFLNFASDDRPVRQSAGNGGMSDLRELGVSI